MRKPDLIAEIANLLPEVMRALLDRPMASGDFELTIAQVRALGAISGRGEAAAPAQPEDADRRDSAATSMGEVARNLGISLSASTGLVDRLVQKGLVERGADPNDRRIVCLRLAPAGRSARDAFLKERRRRMQAALRRLPAGDLRRIADGLAALRKAFSAAAKEES